MLDELRFQHYTLPYLQDGCSAEHIVVGNNLAKFSLLLNPLRCRSIMGPCVVEMDR